MSTPAPESAQSIRRNRGFITQAMNTPMLTPEREHLLAKRWREEQDVAALHELVAAYMRLVIATASRFRQYALPMSDLVQEGNVGLMQAAARFEPEREVRFSTYASWWIRSAMQDYVLRNWSIVRTGTSAAQKALFFNLRWLRARIEKGSDAPLTDAVYARIAADLKVPLREVSAMAQRLGGRDHSLNQPVGEQGSDEWEDFLPDPGPSPEDSAMKRLDGESRGRWLRAALSELSERERMIVEARMLAEERSTLEELGTSLGITKERVRQIEHRAFEKLRAAVLRRSDQPAAA